MKKTLKIILVIFSLMPLCIRALESNIGGITVPSSKTTVKSTSKDCVNGIYRVKNVLGVRVSFYDEKGKQLGETIDVWNQNFRSGSEVSNTLATNNGFKPYSQKINHANGLPSRIDYYNKLATFNLTGSTYNYYVDTKATGNILNYDKDSATALRTYFTTPSVVQRYMNLTKVKGVTSKNAEYTIVIETLIIAQGCKNLANYGGVYTMADLGSLGKGNNINLYCAVPQYLYLTANGKIGNIEFTKPNFASHVCFDKKGRTTSTTQNFKYAELTGSSKLGVGMGFVYGKDVCKQSCEGQHYEIVYRTLDLNNPFLGIDGKIRTLSTESNWYGKQNTIDTAIYEKAPLYTVTLTPSMIRKIKADNATQNINYSNILAKYKDGDTFGKSQFKKDFGL